MFSMCILWCVLIGWQWNVSLLLITAEWKATEHFSAQWCSAQNLVHSSAKQSAGTSDINLPPITSLLKQRHYLTVLYNRNWANLSDHTTKKKFWKYTPNKLGFFSWWLLLLIKWKKFVYITRTSHSKQEFLIYYLQIGIWNH